MDTITQTHINNIDTTNRDVQNEAYFYLMEATAQPVPWAYDVWDTMVAMLRHHDNHQRAIAAQLLANLAANSDPDQRILRDFEALLAVTKDQRFVTARHCLQSLWKIGRAGDVQRQLVIDGFERRFRECETEKNGTLIRHDIIQGMKNLYDVVPDEEIRTKALDLIETENDPKYRKKYATVWKARKRA